MYIFASFQNVSLHSPIHEMLSSSQQLLSFKDYPELGELPPRSPLEPVCEDGPFGPLKEERKRTPRELRELWKKAIIQQILLLRMEKENQKLQGW